MRNHAPPFLSISHLLFFALLSLSTLVLTEAETCPDYTQLAPEVAAKFRDPSKPKLAWCLEACPPVCQSHLPSNHSVTCELIDGSSWTKPEKFFLQTFKAAEEAKKAPDMILGRMMPLYRSMFARHHLFRANHGKFLYSGIAGVAQLDEKVEIIKQMSKFYHDHHCDLMDSGLVPRQWNIHTKGHCEVAVKKLQEIDAKAQSDKKTKKLWVTKKLLTTGSRQSQFWDSTAAVLKQIKCAGNSSVPFQSHGFRGTIQEYIEPYLAGGTAFDSRSLMLIASTNPWVVFVRPGYFRRSLEPYSLEKLMSGEKISAKMHVEDTPSNNPDTMWLPEKMAKKLEEEGKMTSQTFWRKYKAAIYKTALLSMLPFHKTLKPNNGTYYLLTMDHVVNKNGDWVFLEWNTRPLGRRATLSRRTGKMRRQDAGKGEGRDKPKERPLSGKWRAASLAEATSLVIELQSGQLNIGELPFGYQWSPPTKNTGDRDKNNQWELVWTSLWGDYYYDPVKGPVPCAPCGEAKAALRCVRNATTPLC
eukprot:TRINITY_DN65172_c1_g1_i2.p1 TRINITY_DN65172_c1_g1~~TRINITY_DN65172_c1_g1_i2.p1  ORF type:complete len:557 (+),score=45.06 TRINITY_DN65172_c1_g1_i2:86-1672(+)